MKLRTLRSILTVSVLALLTACGAGDFPADTANQSASLVGSSTPATAAVTTSVAATPATGEQPLPDCHPEQCAGLRIIDGNAEAFRIDAMRRAAQGS